MHSLLEQYLVEVTAYLEPLPLKRRAEELREMRSHLESAVAAVRQHGLSEEEAARESVQQFGAVQAVGLELVTAWRREETMRERRSLWGAATSALALTALVGQVEGPLTDYTAAHITHSAQAKILFSPTYTGLFMVFDFVFTVLVGGVSGFLFPRRAVAGAILGMSVWATYTAVTAFHAVMKIPNVFRTPIVPSYVMSLIIGVTLAVDLALTAGITVFSAWAVSRWRVGVGRRARQA